MFELYQTTSGSRGSLAEVWIDKTAMLVKKIYKPDGVTIRGLKPLYNDISEISKLFANEIKWSQELKSPYVLEIYEYGELPRNQGFYCIQEYVGPDLLHYYNGVHLCDSIPNPRQQIIDMFKYFRSKGVYKLNNAMCNLTNHNGQIKAFDFKYATARRPEMRQYELHSIDTWVAKIDPTLAETLRAYV